MNVQMINEIMHTITRDLPVSADLAGRFTLDDWRMMSALGKDYFAINSNTEDYPDDVRDEVFQRLMSRPPAALAFVTAGELL